MTKSFNINKNVFLESQVISFSILVLDICDLLLTTILENIEMVSFVRRNKFGEEVDCGYISNSTNIDFIE